MNATLLLRLDAPMQSWGLRSRFEHRDTATEPTKSGIIGLLAAALGRPRDADVSDLAALRLVVRCDREGRVERDYHTVQGVPNTAGRGHRTIVSERYYLADACFLVALGGDREILAHAATALRQPRFPLFLGRRAFPAPPDLLIGITDATADDAVRAHPVLGTPHPEMLRVVAETTPGNDRETRNDQPISFDTADRRHAPRYVHTSYLPAPGPEGMTP